MSCISHASPRTADIHTTGTAMQLKRWSQDDGNSLIETALLLPVLLVLAFASIDLGYSMIVIANLASATRVASLYSAEGFASQAMTGLPLAGPLSDNRSVAGLTSAELAGLLNRDSSTTIQVCTAAQGILNSTPACSSFGGGASGFTPDVDPESPNFLLHRVDVTYTVQPPIPLSFFSFQLIPTLNLHRQLSVRMME